MRNEAMGQRAIRRQRPPFSTRRSGINWRNIDLRLQDEQNTLTRERAVPTFDYWRASAQQLLSDSQAAVSRGVRMAYSKSSSNKPLQPQRGCGLSVPARASDLGHNAIGVVSISERAPKVGVSRQPLAGQSFGF